MKKIYLIKGLSFLTLAQIMVGLNIVVSKNILSHIPFFMVLTIRFHISTLLLLIFHWCSADRKISIHEYFKQLHAKDWIYLISQALFAGVLFNVFMMNGLKHTDANVAGIITSALPAIIALFSWKILDYKFSMKIALCILFATVGLIIIALDKFYLISNDHSFLGDFLVLFSLLPEAIYYVLCQLHTNKLPVFLTSALLNGINAVLLVLFLPFINFNIMLLNLNDWITVFILGLSSGLFYVFWLIGNKNVTGMLLGLSTAIMPVATVLFAWFLLGERLTAIQGLGMGFVLFSILVYAKR